MCTILKLHYAKFDASRLNLFKNYGRKIIRGSLDPPPLVKEGLSYFTFSRAWKEVYLEIYVLPYDFSI